MKKMLILIGLNCCLSQLHAGEDIIFIDGFDFTGPQLNCPNAPPLISVIDEFGNEYFIAEGAFGYSQPRSYFSIDFDAFEWYEFDVFAGEPPYGSQLLLSIYPNDGSELLAQNTDRLRSNDAFIYRALSTDSFCLMVEYNPSWPDLEPNAAEYYFKLTTTPVVFEDMDEYNLEVEPNDVVSQAQDALSWVDWDFKQYTHVLGGFNSTTDVDVYKITTPENTQSLLTNNYSAGLNEDGNNAEYSKLELIANNGVDVMAELDPRIVKGIVNLPVASNTDYYVRLSSPEQPMGDNPAYVVELETNDYGYQQELNNLTNDTANGAEIAVNVLSGVSPAPPFNVYTVAGELSGNSDVDWWQFEVDPYSELSLYCYSAHHGSGVIDAVFEVYSDPTMSVLQAEVENSQTGVIWSESSDSTLPPLVLGSDETHYLRIAASQFSGNVIGRYYSCGIYVSN